MDKAIDGFLTERKSNQIKKKVKATMTDEEIAVIENEIEETFLLENWLPNAAKRAGQLSLVSHPSKFSHPSAKTSSIIGEFKKAEDGFLRSGNAHSELDVFGNAAALDVFKFLSLTLDDGKTILQHLELETEKIKNEFSISTTSFDEIAEGLLAIKKQEIKSVTSDKVKQVYFPVPNDGYHLLSILTPSGLMYELRNRIQDMRFSEQTKEARADRRKEVYNESGFDDIYNLSMIGYGGTKPQNISVLNSTYGGKAYLLPSIPPSLKEQYQRLPKKDFFTETLWPKSFKEDFDALHNLIKNDYNNINIREGRDRRIQSIVDQVIVKMWSIRMHDSGWSSGEVYDQLPNHQKIWLDNENEKERDNDDSWLNKIMIELARWFLMAYERMIGRQAISLGDIELLHIKSTIEQNKEDLR